MWFILGIITGAALMVLLQYLDIFYNIFDFLDKDIDHE